MKFGVVQFPGSNCDDDAFQAIRMVIGQPVEFIWHQSEDLAGCDAVILPGGFAFGDYLRTGAIARFSPVMKSVDRFARSGCGIKPSTFRSRLQIPAMACSEPFGFASRSPGAASWPLGVT